MTKRIMAKIDEYQKDGQTKGKYREIGVVLSNDNGEYLLLNPDVSLAGVLAQQNALEFKKGGQMRSNVMCSIFTDDNQQVPTMAQQQNQQQTNNFNQQGGFPNNGQPQF